MVSLRAASRTIVREPGSRFELGIVGIAEFASEFAFGMLFLHQTTDEHLQRPGFDHHCPFMDACVSANTFKAFACFLFVRRRLLSSALFSFAHLSHLSDYPTADWLRRGAFDTYPAPSCPRGHSGHLVDPGDEGRLVVEMVELGRRTGMEVGTRL